MTEIPPIASSSLECTMADGRDFLAEMRHFERDEQVAHAVALGYNGLRRVLPSTEGCVGVDSKGSALSSPEEMMAELDNTATATAVGYSYAPRDEQGSVTHASADAVQSFPHDDQISGESLEAIHQFIKANLPGVRAGTCTWPPVISRKESAQYSRGAAPGDVCIVVESLHSDRKFVHATRDGTPNPLVWVLNEKKARWERTGGYKPPKNAAKGRAKGADNDLLNVPPDDDLVYVPPRVRQCAHLRSCTLGSNSRVQEEED